MNWEHSQDLTNESFYSTAIRQPVKLQFLCGRNRYMKISVFNRPKYFYHYLIMLRALSLSLSYNTRTQSHATDWSAGGKILGDSCTLSSLLDLNPTVTLRLKSSRRENWAARGYVEKGKEAAESRSSGKGKHQIPVNPVVAVLPPFTPGTCTSEIARIGLRRLTEEQEVYAGAKKFKISFPNRSIPIHPSPTG